jgi:hypothetical protein
MDNSNTAAYHIHTKYKTATGTFKKELTTWYYWFLFSQIWVRKIKSWETQDIRIWWHVPVVTSVGCTRTKRWKLQEVNGISTFCVYGCACVIFQGTTLCSKNNPQYSKEWMWNEHTDVAWVFHKYNFDIMGYLNVPCA